MSLFVKNSLKKRFRRKTKRIDRYKTRSHPIEQLEARLLLTVASDPDQVLISGDQPIDLELARIDVDATEDLAGISADGKLLVALNGADDTWQSATITDLGLGPLNALTLSFFNNDGFADMAVQGPSSISFLQGDGSGAFTVSQTISAPTAGVFAPSDGSPIGMEVAPLNSDLVFDVISVAPGDNELLVFHGFGDGTFDPPVHYPSGAVDPRVVAVGDFVGDPRFDVVVGHADGTVTFFESDGNQLSLQTNLTISGLGSIVDLASTDVDGDGDLDLAVSGGDQVTLLLNDDDALTVTPIENGDFSFGLTGWETEVIGHADTARPGRVGALGGFVQLVENESFLVSLQQTISIPPAPQTISFDIESILLDDPFDGTFTSAKASGVPDAFEVSLLDANNQSLVPTHRGEATSFFNINPLGQVETAAGVTFDGTTVTLDISSLAESTEATLYFDLIGNPPGTESVVSIDNVTISPEFIYNSTFTPVPLAGPFLDSAGIDSGDVDGDGFIDIVVADSAADLLVVFNGDADGTFTRSEIDVSVSGAAPVAVAIGELTEGDMIDDITASLRDSDRVLSPLGAAFDTTPPNVMFIDPASNAVLTSSISTITIQFTEDVVDNGPSGTNSVTNPAAYELVNFGPNDTYDGGSGDDVIIPISSISYDPSTFEAVLTIDAGSLPLIDGRYQLIVEGDDPAFAIQDQAGNLLMDGVDGVSTYLVNTPPVITPNPNVAQSEGAITTVSVDFSDPGYLDTWTATIDWGDGTTTTGAISETAGIGTISGTHVYADNGNYVATVSITDDQNGSDTTNLTAAISNEIPTLELLGDQTLAEGDTFAFSLDFTDPGFTSTIAGTEETFTATIDWGDGSPLEAATVTVTQGSEGVLTAGTVSGSHVYVQDGEYAVIVTLQDDDSGTAFASRTYTVDNAAPEVQSISSVAAEEGETVTLTAEFRDAGIQDTHSWEIDWGDGLTSSGDATAVLGQGTVNATHIYADNGSYDISFTLTDDAGDEATGATVASITNVDPMVTVSPDTILEEGTTLTIDVATFADPGFTNAAAQTAETFSAIIDWGDGTVEPGTLVVTQGSAGVPTTGVVAGSHTYPHEGPFVITVEVTDDDGGASGDAFEVIVENAPPIVTSVTNISGNEGDQLSLTATFTDIGSDDPHTATIDWGDGTSSSGVVTFSDGLGTVTANHVYQDNGAFDIVVTVTDSELSATGFADADIENVAPVATIDGLTVAVPGQKLDFIGSFTDPGALDTHLLTWQITRDPLATGGVDMCDNHDKPELLVLSFNGSDDANNTQGDKFAATGALNGAAPVYAIASDDDQGTGDIFFSGEVDLDQQFTLDASVDTFGSHTYVLFYDPADIDASGQPISGATPLKTIDIHTSCSAPLVLGETFGGFTLIGYFDQYGEGGSLNPSGAPEVIASGEGDTLHFVPDAPGLYTVHFTVMDDDGGTDLVSQDLNVSHMFLGTDPLHPGESVLFLGGTSVKDSIVVKKEGDEGLLKYIIDSDGQDKIEEIVGPGIDRIVIYGLEGDDHLKVEENVGQIPAELYGGPGEDHLDGGAGDDFLSGGDGDDDVHGKKGRDILVGGYGEDHLDGDDGEDIILGAVYDHFCDRLTVGSLMEEWARTDLNYADRVTNITLGGGVNGTNRLDATTTREDFAQDQIHGKNQLDLLFAYEFGLGEQDDDPDTEEGETVLPAGLPTDATRFYVVDKGDENTYRYGFDGRQVGNLPLGPIGDVRGAAAGSSGNPLWVIDKDEYVYVYDSITDALLGTWKADDAKYPGGIATDGTDIWVVSDDTGQVHVYAGGAAFLSGDHAADSTFDLIAENDKPTGLTTDGTTIWVVDEGDDAVYVYSTAGLFLGSWALDPLNEKATGITTNPNGGTGIWVVDKDDNAIYYYADGTTILDGSQTATSIIPLSPANNDAEGIADPVMTTNIGDVVADSISVSGEVDQWLFDALAGQSIFIDFQVLSGGTTDLRLLDPNGVVIRTDGSSFADGLDGGPLLLGETGAYMLEVWGRGTATPTYQFQLWDVPAADTDAIVFATDESGAIETPGVIDSWTFTSTTGQEIFLNFTQLTGGTLDIRLFNPDGTTLRTDGSSSADGLDGGPLLLTQDGTYTLEVDGRGDDTATYTFQVFDVTAVSSTPVAIGDTINGEITVPGERDEFTFAGTAGQELYFNALTGASNSFNWKLTAPSGSVAFADSHRDRGPLTLSETGTYVLEYDGRGDDTGAYSAEIIEVPLPDENTITFGDTVSGNIETFLSIDRWFFDGTAGQQIFVDMLALTGTLQYNVYSPSGVSLGGARNFVLRAMDAGPITLPEDGVYTIEAISVFGSTPTYTFKLYDVPPPDVSPLVYDTVHSGSIESPGVVDIWTFDGAMEQILFFDTQSTSGQTLDIRLFAPDGSQVFGVFNFVLRTLDSGPFTLPMDGEYTLRFDGSGAEIGDYTFRMWTVPPDNPEPLPLNTDVSRFTVPGQTITFTFDGAVGQTFVVDMIENIDQVLDFNVINPDGTTLVTFDRDRVLPPLPQDGEYKLFVKTDFFRTDDPGGFTLRMQELAPPDIGTPDNQGTDFWLSFSRGVVAFGDPGRPALSMFLVSPVDTTAVVSNPYNHLVQTFDLVAGEVIKVPVSGAYELFGGVENKGLRVTANDEITVYGVSRYPASSDAFLALPNDILGTEHIILDYQDTVLLAAAQFNLVATEDDTTVTITTPVDTGAGPAGVPFTLSMDAGQTYQLSVSNGLDLSGTIVQSDKPIGALAGNSCTFIPPGFGFCDHLAEQLPPTDTWGRHFVTYPLATRLAGDTFRFLAAQDNTTISANGTTIATLNRGEFHEQILTEGSEIIADKPILLAQYSNGQTFDGVVADPFMMVIPPTEQFEANYVVSTLDELFNGHYINIVISTDSVGEVTIDGVPVDAAEFSPIGTSAFSGAQIEVPVRAYTLNSSVPFGAFMYGFGDFDSYGYTGGGSLAPIARVAAIDITPDFGTQTVNKSYTVSAAVVDQAAIPIEGVRVDFFASGTNEATGFGFTNSLGIAEFSYTGTEVGIDSIVAAVGTVTDTSNVDWLHAPLEIRIDSPADGSRFEIGSVPLVTGQAIPSTDGTPIVGVTVDGVAFDSFDAAGNFFQTVEVTADTNTFEFAAIDELGRVATTQLILEGITSPGEVTFDDLSDVTNSGQVTFARTTFNRQTNQLFADAVLTNTATTALAGPVYALTHPFEPARVDLANPDGVTDDGEQYVTYDSELPDGTLSSLEASDPILLEFDNQGRDRFDFEVTLLTPGNEAPQFSSAPTVRGVGDQPYVYAAQASDSNGDTLTFSLEIAPDGMVINADTGVIDWSPTANDIGTHDVKVIVDDGLGGTAEQTFTIQIYPAPPANRDPFIVSTPVTQYNIQSPDTGGELIDLTPWTFVDLAAGGQPPANWQLDATGTTVIQTVNSRASIFLSDFTLTDDRIEGTWRVGTVLDDDFIGFVFGYQDPQHFYLFDWKQNSQSGAARGMTVKVVNADTPLTGGDLWPTAGVPGRVENVYHNSILWADKTTYGFELEFHPGEFTIIVTRGTTVLDTITIQDDTYTGGGFGFYNYSQNAVQYSSFTRETLPERVYRYDVIAVDPDTDPLTYSLVSAPAGMTIDPLTGQIEWPVNSTNVGSYQIEILVTDDQGGSDTQIYTLEILDIQPATVSGTVFNDIDADGLQDTGEVGLQGFALYVEENDNGIRDAAEPIALTDSSGNYQFPSLLPGTYTVRSQLQTGWARTIPADGTASVTVAAGDVVPDINFGLRSNGITQNSPPVITSTEETIAKVNHPYRYPANATDADNDALLFTLLTAPAGMTVDPASGVVVWTPTADQQFPQPVLLQVADGQGGIDLQSYTVFVAPEFLPPIITSDPLLITTVDEPYVYDVEAFDPEDDMLAYLLVAAPAGMTIVPGTGLIEWTPTIADLGSVPVQVRVMDSTGLSAYQTFRIDVRDVNTPPVFTSDPVLEVAAGGTYRYTAVATDVEDDVFYSLETGPAGLAISLYSGRLQWNTDLSDLGSYPVVVRATDDRGLFAEQSYTLEVTPDVTPPQVSVRLSNTLINVGETVTILVSATDNVEVATVSLDIDGVPQTLVNNSVVDYTPTSGGLPNIVANAVDTSGNVGTGAPTPPLRVLDPSDNTPPFVEISSPETRSLVSYLTAIVGTVTDDNLELYRLEISPRNANQWRPIEEVIFQPGSSGPGVINDTLGVFDPTLLSNTIYDVRVFAQDTNGLQTTRQIQLSVEANAKIGNFVQPITDLTIPVAGGPPIDVTRTYDTLNADESGDFGHGWQYCMLEPRIRETAPVGQFEYLLGAFAAVGLRDGDKVYITTPDCQRVGFTFSPTPHTGIWTLVSDQFFDPRWLPDPGVDFELYGEFDFQALTGIASSNFDRNGLPLPIVRLGDGSYIVAQLGAAYNPEGYQLFSKDQTRWHYNQNTGLQDVTDRNGNRLIVGEDGITSSSGQQVQFQRDTQGRITRLIDPAGNEYVYTYNAAGDLEHVEYPNGLNSDYEYNGGPEHYLSAINGDDDIQADTSRLDAIYDPIGRLAAIVGAQGQTTSLTYNIDENTERIIDPLGNVTTIEYDDRGNVVREVDAVGDEVLMSYDANDNVILYTDGREFSTAFEWNGRGNPTKVIDPLGAVTEFAYSELNELTSVVNPVGTFTYEYNEFGQMTSIVDPLGQTGAMTYDQFGRMTSSTDAHGDTTFYEYDHNGPGASRVINPDNTQISFSYDDNERIVSFVDENGHGMDIARDARGRVLSTTDALGQTSTYTFTGLYETSFTDSQGRVTNLVYDDSGRLTEVVDPMGNATRYTYDAKGNRTSIVDPLGRTTLMRYRGDGEIESITDPLNATTFITYDASKNVSSLTDGNGNTVAFEYDGRNELIRQSDPLGNTWQYDYDIGRRLTSQTDANGNTTTFVYDELNQLLQEIDALGGTTAFTYDAVGNVTSQEDANGNVTSFEYDSRRRLIRQINAAGGVREFTHDEIGNVVAETDELGRTTTAVYDDLDRLVSATDPLGGIQSWRYTPNGEVATYTDELGRTASNTYDALGRLVATTDPLGHVTQFHFDAVGNLIERVDALGRSTQFAYDGRNRLIMTTDPTGEVSALSYDAVGNPISQTDPQGNTTLYGYDAADRMVSMTDSEGGVIEFAYDANGNRTSTTDQLDRTTTDAFDALNRLISSADANNATTTRTYDAVGNIVSLTDPLGNVTSFEYDRLNRNVRETDPLGNASSFTFDAVGNLTSMTDRNGRVSHFAYDNLDRRISETWLTDGVPVYTATSSYDAAGNIVSADDPHSHYSFSYDLLNRLATSDNAGTPGVPRVILSYDYDPVGNPISVSDNDGVRVDSAFEDRDFVSSMSWSGGGVDELRVDFTYDSRGNRTATKRYDDASSTQSASRSTYEYDTKGLATRISHFDAVDTILTEYDYVRDLADQLLSETHHGETSTYTHDAVGQIISATYTNRNGESYSYDDNGNRIGVDYVIGANNQILSDEQFDYLYDAEGNIVSKTERLTGEITRYEFDHRNRLSRVTVESTGGSLLQETEFGYDVFNRRIEKSVDPDGDGAQRRESTFTAYDGEHAWADYDASGDVVARYLFGTRADEILARWQPGNGIAWYLMDRLGTVRDIVDGVGLLINTITYDSYGNVVSETNPNAGDRFKYTGREYDAEIALYYYRSRYYDANLGRFIGQDSLGFAAGDANLYRYVGNNPLGATDPSGNLAIIEKTLLIPGATAAGFGAGYVLGRWCATWKAWGDRLNLDDPAVKANIHDAATQSGGIGGAMGAAFGSLSFGLFHGLGISLGAGFTLGLGSFSFGFVLGNGLLFGDFNEIWAQRECNPRKPLAHMMCLYAEIGAILVGTTLGSGGSRTPSPNRTVRVDGPHNLKGPHFTDPNKLWFSIDVSGKNTIVSQFDVAADTAIVAQKHTGVLKAPGKGPNRIYSARELIRRGEEPGPFHNFPESFDSVIYEQGTKTVVPNFFNKPKPCLSNDSIQYRLPGVVNGREGVFEIFTRPSKSGDTEVVIHRFFNPKKSK